MRVVKQDKGSRYLKWVPQRCVVKQDDNLFSFIRVVRVDIDRFIMVVDILSGSQMCIAKQDMGSRYFKWVPQRYVVKQDHIFFSL